MPYVNRILNAKRKNYVNAQRENYNSVVLKGRARQVAEKFALLATTREFEKSYREAMSEIDRQKPLFDDEDVKDSAPLEEINRQNVDRDPPYCRPSDAEIKLASERFDRTTSTMSGRLSGKTLDWCLGLLLHYFFSPATPTRQTQ